MATPFDDNPANQRFVSTTQPIAYAEIQFDQRANDVDIAEAARMRNLVKDASNDKVEFELGGPMFVEQTMPASEVVGILAAVVILLVAFGSLLAMGLPIMTALAGISIGLAIVEILAHVLDVPSFAPQVTAMIGIGVGIDYALFIVTRYRDALHEGRTPRESVVHAINTSGRAVLFAGCTVVISLLGLFVVGLSFIRGMATGAAVAVLIVMLASVTLLPAVLGFVGQTIDKFALPNAKRQEVTKDSMWVRWSETLQRRPWTAALAGLVILLVLAAAGVRAPARRRRRRQRPDQPDHPSRLRPAGRRASAPAAAGRCSWSPRSTDRSSRPPSSSSPPTWPPPRVCSRSARS